MYIKETDSSCLDELYIKDSSETSVTTAKFNSRFYHFYDDLFDLLNSIKQGIIYSNKNASPSQLDVYHPDEAYVCFTKGMIGRDRMQRTFGKPFGLGFMSSNLQRICKKHDYIFDPNEPYNQFSAKTQYSINNQNEISLISPDDKRLNQFRDYRLRAIGQLEDGRYFISGGPGNGNAYIYSNLFTDQKLYNTLRDWFMKNMNSSGTVSEGVY